MATKLNERCKACGAEVMVVWLPNGVRLPVDASPHPDGNICVLRDQTGETTAWLARPNDKALTYRNHFISCAKARG